MPTFNLAASLDDAGETFGGSLGSLYNYDEVKVTATVSGSPSTDIRGVSMFRFANVTIPQGALVTAASFTGVVTGKEDDINATIRAHKVVDSPQASAMPAIAQTITAGGTTTGPYSTSSWTPGSNDLCLCFVSLRAVATRTVASVSGNGLTWSSGATSVETGGIIRGAWFWAQGASPTAGAVTVTLGGSGTVNACAIQVMRIPNAELTTGEQIALVAGTSTSPSQTGTRPGSRLVIAGVAHRGTGTFSVGTSPDTFTANTLNTSFGSTTSRANISTEYQTVRGASATETWNGTLSGSDSWVVMPVMVKPIVANTVRQRLNDNPTTASTSWVSANSGLDAPETSPDISSVIQEIVDQPGWVSGNALTLLIAGASTDGIADFATENHATLSPASLDISYSHSLAASGASTSSGSAALLLQTTLAASGSSSSSGSAALRLTMAFAASGGSTSTGTADLRSIKPLAASGASSSSGSAVMQLRIPLAASGSSTSSGEANVQGITTWTLAGAGASSSTGSAALNLRLAMVATGSSSSTGTAALALRVPLSASGSTASSGSAALQLVIPLSAMGASTTVGAATLLTIVTLQAIGASVSSGSADLLGGADVPTLSIVIGGPTSGWSSGSSGSAWPVVSGSSGWSSGPAQLTF